VGVIGVMVGAAIAVVAHLFQPGTVRDEIAAVFRHPIWAVRAEGQRILLAPLDGRGQPIPSRNRVITHEVESASPAGTVPGVRKVHRTDRMNRLAGTIAVASLATCVFFAPPAHPDAEMR
jgi:hypothetical protein